MALAYIDKLIEKATKSLGSLFRLTTDSAVYLNNYHIVNTYLFTLAKMQRRNFYLSVYSYNSLDEHYLPIVYELATDLLRKNNELPKPVAEKLPIGSVIVSNNIRKTLGKEHGKYYLKYPIKSGYRKTYYKTSDDVLKNSYVTDDIHCPDNVRGKSLEEYHRLAGDILDVDHYPPSLFEHRAIVVCKTSIMRELIRKHNLKYCFPHAYLSQDGKTYNDLSHPLRPMILFCSDYDNAREFILGTQSGNVDMLLVFGDQQITKYKYSIKRDHRQGLLGNYFFFASTPLQRDNDVALWNWTAREERYLYGMHSVTIKYETYPLNSDLKETVSHYEEMLNSVKDEYGEGDCLVPVHVGFRAIMNRKIGFSGDFNMEFGQSIMENTIAELEKYYLNIDEVTKKIKSLVESLGDIYKTIHDGPDYLDTLAESYPGALSLVVPNRMVESWHKHLASRNMSNCSVVPFWSFIKLLKNGQHQSMYLFPNTINYHHYETLSHLSLKQPVKAIFLLYAPELTKLRSMIRRQDKYIKLKSGVKDTLLLPEMDIQDDYKQRESTDDLVTRLEEGLESDIDTSPYEYSNDVDATTMRVKVIDLNGLTQEVSIGSRVIRIGESGRTLCSIQDLCVGDVILHYSNKSIELLYAQVAEGSNQFKIVERDSELWKNMLRKYLSFEVKSDGDFVINVQKLNELSVVLGISNQYIQDAWIRNLNRVKYPQKGSLHKLLDILLNCGLVSDPERHSIIRSRSLYNSVMISLGQNLSTEVQGIASATTDDVLLDFMTTAVYQNVEEYPILSGFEPEVGAAIVKANFDRMVFLGFTTHDESNKSTNNQDLPVYSGDQIEGITNDLQ